MKKLILMCGIPASGKSTIADILSVYMNNAPIVSMDGIREMLFGTRKCQKQGDLVYTLAVNKTIRLFQECDIVIFDATNRTKKAREKLIEDIQTYYNCYVYCIFVNTPVDIALGRNSNRDESIQVPPAVIHRMYDTLQPPTNDEYSYEKIFEITSESLDIYQDLVYNIYMN